MSYLLFAAFLLGAALMLSVLTWALNTHHRRRADHSRRDLKLPHNFRPDR